eukprot:gb/GECG01010681.1/.p1 GENE.gb/GECG01010681.1/~~gb/GECG01010681.1/.p1  ORF type:complete len:365 (+),score=71.69 gb/GECG01010681.1/:1-1095(+)
MSKSGSASTTSRRTGSASFYPSSRNETSTPIYQGASNAVGGSSNSGRMTGPWRGDSRRFSPADAPQEEADSDDLEEQEVQQVLQQRHQQPQVKSDAWKAFAGTEAGRLLSRIYGGNKPQVNVPAPKTRTTSEPRPDFIPAGGMPEADARTATFNREEIRNMDVPQVGVKKSKPKAPIEANDSRRRNLENIKRFESEQRRKAEGTAEPLRKPVATETEKRKLQSLNQYKGGKSLPEELTQQPLRGNIPLSMITGKKNKNRRANVSYQRDDGKSKELREMDQLHAKIIGEINERNQYIEELEQIDERKAREEMGIIKLEVQERVKDLKRLEKLMDEERQRLEDEENDSSRTADEETACHGQQETEA